MRCLAPLLLIAITAFPAAAKEEVAQAAEESWSRWGKSQLRWMVTGSTDGADERFGLRVDKNWADAPRGVRRVVLIHGFNSSPESMAPLARELRRRGHPCAVACYPNDQAIERSARRLARELQPVVQSAGGAPVGVVTHSMGGLVARRVLEDPRLDPGGVDRMVMIAPPNHGSSLARIAYGTDLYEHTMLPERAGRKTGCYHAIDDGLGEAAHDLLPGSPFLKRLNARERNPRIAYTIVLGNRGRFSDKQLETVRQSLESTAANGRVVGWFSPKVRDALAECDELLAGRGDGAVSLRRGRLAGVDDIHILPATHDMIDLRGATGRRLTELVAKRL